MRASVPIVVALVLLSGCAAPFLGGDATTTNGPSTNDTTATSAATTAASTGSTTTATESGGSYDVTVRNGSLPVDADASYARVQALLGTDVEPRPVEVRNLTEYRGYDPTSYRFFDYLGVGNATFDGDRPGGLTTQSGAVYIHPGNGSPGAVEQVLAHEFVHTAQFRANMLPWLDALDGPRLTYDRLQTRLALVEGGAVYVSDAYTERHLNVTPESERIAAEYESAGTAKRLFLARYHVGSDYVADRIDDPANLASVYEDRPRTTEQVLHGYAPDEEPARDLSLAVRGGNWTVGANDTLGELTTRILLRGELDPETAAAAAEGWGTDEVVTLRQSDRRAYVWALRADGPGEADELEAALGTFAERRGAAADASFAVDRPTDETVALTVAPAPVDVRAEGDAGNVTVTVA
ncbi:hypothetical protein [Halostella litorea]|uniref:hypothetical protein n=1 Tax=Halostella litorea TaxID=2528831 RepID=UPI00109286DF|nr:hypothetical protein [Halostella litorea]